ncbi:TonB-dependent receptor [Membranihabitans marinus]
MTLSQSYGKEDQFPDCDPCKLEIALNSLSEHYAVLFSYKTSLVKNVEVSFRIDEKEDFDAALNRLISGLNLKYKPIDSKYYLLYAQGSENDKNVRRMERKIKSLRSLENETGIKLFRKNEDNSLTLQNIYESAQFQQTGIEVSGTVVNSENEPLIGVNVLVKGTDNGTATDFDGKFILKNVEEDAVLVLSYIGYVSQEIALADNTSLTIVLQEDSQTLDEIVVIGYGTQKKSDLTGSVSQIDAKSFENQSMTQFSDMITGTVAGLNTSQNTSAKGGSSLQIRGPKSLNAATNPMIVLDGSIYNGSINDINPADIESIDILKDASSAAIFGARSAAGVIIVTTKRGKSGKPVFNFSGSTGITEVNNDLEPFSALGYLDFRRDVLIDMQTGNPNYYFFNPNQLPDGVSLDQWRSANSNSQQDNEQEWLSRLGFFDIEIENYLAGETVDWYNEVINRGIRQDYNISIGGGLGKSNYYWSIGYTNNEGVILGDKFSTLRSKLNFDFEVTDWLDIGMNAQLAQSDESGVPASLSYMYLMSPYGSIYNPDGSLKWYPNDYNVQNPLLNSALQQRLNQNTSLFVPLFAKFKLPFGIDYKLSFQPQYVFGKSYNFWPSTTIVGGSSHSKGYGTRYEASSFTWILDNLIHWTKEFDVHSFDLTLLYSSEKAKSFSSNTTNETFLPNENLLYNGLQFGTNPSIYYNDQQVNGDAAMARLNYTLLDKYLVTASIRRDGYSAFGKETPRAVFPALALAWKISEEEFFNVDWISQMKIRSSWGINGNRSIGAYSALAQVSSNLYFDGTNTQIGVRNSSLENYGLAWEKTESINVGLDLGIFQNRIELSADYYDITTNDLLMNRLLPALTGFDNITTNLGELGNRGFEFTLNSYNVVSSNFNWESDFTFSLNRNKIKKLFGDYEEVVVDGQTISREVPDYSNEWFPGEALDRVWNYDVVGIWQADEADAAAQYRLEPGDFKAVDVDENGVYEALSDKQFIGYSAPRFRFGLRNQFTFFKYFTASLFIRADLGHLGAFGEALNNGGATYDKRNRQAIPYWTPENQSNDYARLLTNTTSFGGGLMIYRSRSFVRIQDFTFSYNLPESMMSNIKLQNLRLYGSIRNLYSFDNWPGWDPESGNIPMPRNYSIGLAFSL